MPNIGPGLLLPTRNLIQVPRGQFEVDLSHPLGKGLVGLYIPGSVYGFRDITNNGPLLVPASPIISTSSGPALNSAGATGGATSTGQPTQYQFTSAMTLGYSGYLVAAHGSFAAPMWGVANSSNTYKACLVVTPSTTTQFQGIFRNASGNQTIGTGIDWSLPSSSPAFPNVGVMGVNFTANTVNWTTTNHTTLPGSLAAGTNSLSSAGAPAWNSADQLCLGFYTGGAGVQSVTWDLMGAIWNLDLSSDLQAWFCTEPYAMLKPIVSKTYVGPVTSINGSFSDTIATSDSFNASGLTYQGSISDTVATSDSFAESNLVLTGSLSDTIVTSDSFSTPSGMLFDGVIKKNLVSAGANTKLNVDALIKKNLISAGASSSLRFSGLIKKTLVGVPAMPPTPPVIPVPPTPPVIVNVPQTTFPVKLSAVMDTTIGTIKSGREMRGPNQQYPLWDIEIIFPELLDQTQNISPYAPNVGYTEYMQIVQQWIMAYGQGGLFLYTVPWDYSRENQLIGQGDGVTYGFQIYRTWGSGGTATIAPVSAVNTVTNVSVNGVTVPPAHYQIIRDKIWFIDALGFTYPPASGADITMTFSFYYLCRFVSDELETEEFAKNRYTIASFKFRAVLFV